MYISPRAKLSPEAIVSDTSIILGPTEIGSSTIVDHNTIIGYPTRKSLRRIVKEGSKVFNELLDKASSGAKIGSNCHIRPGTVIYEGVTIGDNVETGHNVMIREESIIGSNVVIGTLTVIEGHVRIGNEVRIESGVFIPVNTVIGNNVFLGPYVVITNDKYPPSKRLAGAIIGDGAIIGANSILIAGVKIGERAVIAAGSVVTKDIPPEVVVAGVPARPIGNRERYEFKRRVWEQLPPSKRM